VQEEQGRAAAMGGHAHAKSGPLEVAKVLLDVDAEVREQACFGVLDLSLECHRLTVAILS
jgi:hypothetical protein